MDSIMICLGYLNMEDIHQTPITYFLEIMLIEESKALRLFAYYSLTKSNTLRTSSSWEETMNVHRSIESMDSTMNVIVSPN